MKQFMLWYWCEGIAIELGQFPDHAFDSDTEKSTLTKILSATVAENRPLTEEENSLFDAVATERSLRYPWRNVLVGIYNSVYYWTTPQGNIGVLASCVPRRFPSIFHDALNTLIIGLKVPTVLFALVGGFIAYQHRLKNSDAFIYFLLLGGLFVILRTLFLCIYFPAPEVRYVIPAWPFVMILSFNGVKGLLVRTK